MLLRVLLLAGAVRCFRRGRRRAGEEPEVRRHVDNPVGLLIEDEVRRAESDLVTVRARAQGVLAISGALVTVLAGLLALAVGKQTALELDGMTVVTAALTLVSFVAATVAVLIIFLPFDADAPKADDLWAYTQNNWGEAGWDEDVAQSLALYLKSMRRVNKAQAKRLALAVFFQVVGIFGAAVMALSLLDQVSKV